MLGHRGYTQRKSQLWQVIAADRRRRGTPGHAPGGTTWRVGGDTAPRPHAVAPAREGLRATGMTFNGRMAAGRHVRSRATCALGPNDGSRYGLHHRVYRPARILISAEELLGQLPRCLGDSLLASRFASRVSGLGLVPGTRVALHPCGRGRVLRRGVAWCHRLYKESHWAAALAAKMGAAAATAMGGAGPP